ncbi:unnamed protein product [Trichogramma brassicae]|uniref:Prokaryotic-type class I peptide chain release factors domain-containing protein n=1 Tax=Trichogramma brassicae TaxID=86971 RepID=A0A6H5IP21_9HYME|nr:unnamed protein product [Trichogramma brassicae]
MNFVGRQCLRILKNDSTATKHVLGFGRSVSFKSAYSLENLYPKSNLTIHTPKFVPEDPNAKFTGYIPIKELDITFCASGGPGGQNVQRVNTKVDLRFNVKSATWIDDELKEKILEKDTEQNLDTRIERRKTELERNQKRLQALRKVRPAFMEEFEKHEVELKSLYDDYLQKFRYLAYLEHLYDDAAKAEQERFERK